MKNLENVVKVEKRGAIKLQLFTSRGIEFRSVADAFNHYRNSTEEEIEDRITEIKAMINKDGNVDVEILNLEVEGLKQAKENIEDRSQHRRSNFNPVTQRNFNNDKPIEDDELFSSTEYRNAFYKQLLGQDLNEKECKVFNRAMDIQTAERRADAFNTTTNSASVLPTHTLNEVIRKARKQGGIIDHARNFNIPSNLSVPVGTPGDRAKWHIEGEKVDSEKVETVNVEFGSNEILKVFSISASAKKMSIQAFESYLIEELTASVMETIEHSLVHGTGTKQGLGIMDGVTWNVENSLEFAKAGKMKYTDFTEMMALLKRGYSADSKFAMNNATLYKEVYGIVDKNDRPIFTADPQNESIGHILGKEVVIDDNLEEDVVILGNFNYLGYNMPEGIMVEVSRESSFRSGLVDYRALAIADTRPLVDEAFIKLERATV